MAIFARIKNKLHKPATPLPPSPGPSRHGRLTVSSSDNGCEICWAEIATTRAAGRLMTMIDRAVLTWEPVVPPQGLITTRLLFPSGGQNQNIDIATLPT